MHGSRARMCAWTSTLQRRACDCYTTRETKTDCGRRIGSRSSRSALRAPPPAARSRCCAPAPPFTGSKPAVLLIRRHRNKSGQGDRTCTCMISLPRGVADYLAPHPDVEIVRLRSSSYGETPRHSFPTRKATAGEPARRRARSGPVLFSVINGSAGGGRSRRVR